MVASLFLALLQAPALTGTVFLDRNANGVRDPGEPGVPRAVVSNQISVTRTDAAGHFSLPTSGASVVFVSLPNGYRSIGPFWRKSSDSSIAFALAPAVRPRAFTFLHASDTHLDSASLPRTRRLERLVDSLRPDLVLITGDLVRDALRVSDTVALARYDLFAAERRRFTRPVWTVPGNHELFGIERQRSHVSPDHPLLGRGMYRHYFGPDYYSFNFGGVHFVGLNTQDIDDQWYYGHVDSLQLGWLEQDLAQVPATTPVVTFNHIPFFSAVEVINGYSDEPPAPSLITVRGTTAFRHTVSNAGAVLAVLRRHRFPLALGGHMHVRENLEYQLGGQPTRFEQAAAVVGPSQGAGLDFRSGVTLYHVNQGVISRGRFFAFPDPPAATEARAPGRWVDSSPHQVKFVQEGPNLRLEVLDWGGSGPPMLFLAGLDDTGHEFDDFAPRWTNRYHVYALTRRGFGASSQPAGGYQVDSLANDIRIVLDSLGLERPVLVGHSLAGDEMTRFATSWPERVSKLVYLDAAHDRVPLVALLKETPPPAPSPMTRSDSLSPEALRDYQFRINGVRLTLGEILSIAVFGPDGRYQRDITPGSIDQSILAGLEHPRYSKILAPALAFYAVADSAPDMFAQYREMSEPNRARADRFFAVFGPWTAQERARFQREAAGGRVVEIHGAHHYIFISNEAEVLREMAGFLGMP